MSDSDDNYFTDELVLDDKTLAVLDAEESKFIRATSTQTQQSVGPPPSKRQRTMGSCLPQPQRTLHATDTLGDLDDLPDVSVRRDGTYAVQDKQKRPSGPPTHRQGIAPGPNVVMPVGSAGATGGPRTVAPAIRGAAPVMRSTGPARVTLVPSRPPSSARGTRSTQSPASSQEVSRVPSLGLPQRVNRVPPATASGSHADQLLQQIDELRKKNEAIRAEMESALEAKFAKEGEVTILRKRLEKTTQEHLAQVTKLKSAKDESDAKHVLLQKQFEADKERLKTELTFRRHELETSSRKHSPAVLPGEPPLATQRQRLGQWNSAGPPRLPPETPRRPRFGVISDFEKPKNSPALETQHLPSGFQAGPPSFGGHKGKKTNSFSTFQGPAIISSTSQVLPNASSQFFRPGAFSTPMDDGGPAEDFVPDVSVDDVHMVEAETPAMSLSTQENTTVLALPSWNLVLHDIMLTHKLQGSELPTLQLLVCVSLADAVQVQSYGAALLRIFDTLGSIPTQSGGDFDDLARVICCALCEITELLVKNNLITPLTAALNLLTKLAYMSPSIRAPLLSQRSSDPDGTPHVLEVLHSIIGDQLQKLDVTTGNEPPELHSLGKETLSLYEAMVWWIPDDIEDRQGSPAGHMPLANSELRLSTCSSLSNLLTTLLRPRRPLWFLVESMWLLTWLSTRRSLRVFRSLLSSEPARSSEGPASVVLPQIGLVCSLLTDTNHHGLEADELKSRIIMFFSILSNVHPDAYTLLVESQELIPSIVLYICHLAVPIWGFDGAVLHNFQAATRTVQLINHAMLLLYHLVIGEDATVDLRERLSCARAETHQALIHPFIPTFGCLSYASPPYWLDVKDKEKLSAVGALARALLERVIQGPELDMIWETYQDDGDESNEASMDVDDEEVEAQIIANS